MDDVKVTKNKNSNTSQDVLIVNNIEVVYSHVILVLKGVSLNVKKGGITALPNRSLALHGVLDSEVGLTSELAVS